MTTCRNHLLFSKRCKNPARWVVRINDDPDTDIDLCGVHADLCVKRCWPTPVTKTIIAEGSSP